MPSGPRDVEILAETVEARLQLEAYGMESFQEENIA